jgi:hypothetical protein
MDNCAPFVFLGSWALVISYVCFRFCIFNILVLEEYVFQVEGVHTYFNHAYVQCKKTFFL